jgi:Ion channel
MPPRSPVEASVESNVQADSDKHTKPLAIERWIESTFRAYRFGVVLVLLLATYGLMTAAPTGAWTRVVTTALQGLTLLAALRASAVNRRIFRLAAVVVTLALLSSIVSVFLTSSTEASGVFHALDVLMISVAPVAIARALWRRPVIDVHTALGAICIYVLLGMIFAFTYSAIGSAGDESFFVQTSNPGLDIYLYFSFVTLTTVGYGDYTAANGLGRSLATLEALLGQVYLVTVVALIVSTMTRTRAARGSAADGPGDPPDASSDT